LAFEYIRLDVVQDDLNSAFNDLINLGLLAAAGNQAELNLVRRTADVNPISQPPRSILTQQLSIRPQGGNRRTHREVADKG